MEDRETARMRKYGESKTTHIMMVTVPRVTSGLGLRKFQADGFLLKRVYNGYRVSLQEVKWPVCVANHEPPPSTVVKERVELYMNSPSLPSCSVPG